MNYSWLNQNKNNKFILFFNGWAMDEDIVNHLKNNDFDILMLNDYRKIDEKLKEFDFSKYTEKYLVCWSMGGYIANKFEFLNSFDKKIAICSTNKIIDDNYGIPNRIYNLTINNFSDKSKERFLKNIFLDEKKDIVINRTTKELQDELISINDLKVQDCIKFNKAIIAKKDIVVPYKNQMNYWKETNAQIVEIDAPHYVFNYFQNWDEIIC